MNWSFKQNYGSKRLKQPWILTVTRPQLFHLIPDLQNHNGKGPIGNCMRQNKKQVEIECRIADRWINENPWSSDAQIRACPGARLPGPGTLPPTNTSNCGFWNTKQAEIQSRNEVRFGQSERKNEAWDGAEDRWQVKREGGGEPEAAWPASYLLRAGGGFPVRCGGREGKAAPLELSSGENRRTRTHVPRRMERCWRALRFAPGLSVLGRGSLRFWSKKNVSSTQKWMV
jgi:hypothetical protein